MERARKAEKRAREEGGGVREERQKDFTVCLTGRPEGHTRTHTHTHTHTHTIAHTQSALSAWRCGGG